MRGINVPPTKVSGETFVGYLRRLLLFNCLWLIAVLGISLGSAILVGDPNVVPLWYVAFAPIGYVVGLIVTVPIAVAVGALTWLVWNGTTLNRRLVGIAATLIVWLPLIAIAAASRSYDSRTVAESAITLAVSGVLFAALIPLPDCVREPATGRA